MLVHEIGYSGIHYRSCKAIIKKIQIIPVDSDLKDFNSVRKHGRLNAYSSSRSSK